MIRIVATMIPVTGSVAAFTQQPADDPRRAGIRIMRIINTVEAAVRSKTGKYADLGDLRNNKSLGPLHTEIVTNGSFYFHQGQQLRLVLSGDGSQYHAMVVPVEACGTAVFSDERGLI